MDVRHGYGSSTTLAVEVCTQRNFVTDFIRLKLNYIQKTKKSFFEPPFRDFGTQHLRTPSTARWKARGRLSICHNWTFFAISYCWNVISGNLSKSALFEGVGNFQRIFRVARTIPSNSCWSGKTRDIPVLYCVEILTEDYFVFSQYTHLTHGQTDGQNCDGNTVCCIACSRTVKMWNLRLYWSLHRELLLTSCCN